MRKPDGAGRGVVRAQAWSQVKVNSGKLKATLKPLKRSPLFYGGVTGDDTLVSKEQQVVRPPHDRPHPSEMFLSNRQYVRGPLLYKSKQGNALHVVVFFSDQGPRSFLLSPVSDTMYNIPSDAWRSACFRNL